MRKTCSASEGSFLMPRPRTRQRRGGSSVSDPLDGSRIAGAVLQRPMEVRVKLAPVEQPAPLVTVTGKRPTAQPCAHCCGRELQVLRDLFDGQPRVGLRW